MKLSLIGDIHGKIECLLPLLERRCQDSDLTIQLGDMGLGFKGAILPEQNSSFKFIRGNHDSPDFCRMHPNYAGEFGQVGPVFVIGGAYSIDWMHRVPGKSWWPNEELSVEQLDAALETYKAAKPQIVASHEAPSSIGRALLEDGGFRLYKSGCIGSRTAQYLERMFHAYQPEHWFFGHYHRDWMIQKEGTTFHCLNELSMAHLTI
jgi:Calcineurin-like phosphoesterase superfamily domain